MGVERRLFHPHNGLGMRLAIFHDIHNVSEAPPPICLPKYSISCYILLFFTTANSLGFEPYPSGLPPWQSGIHSVNSSSWIESLFLAMSTCIHHYSILSRIKTIYVPQVLPLNPSRVVRPCLFNPMYLSDITTAYSLGFKPCIIPQAFPLGRVVRT